MTHNIDMKVKLLTLRHRWMVHRGRSSEQKDFIFGVQRSHPLDMTPRLDVFMASNINVNGDISSSFQLVGSHIDNSCKVYNGDTMIAEVPDFSIICADFNHFIQSFQETK